MSNLTSWSRRLAKTVVAGAVGPLLPRRAPLVIGYHRVVENFDAEARTMMPSMLVSRAMLERQLDCLGRHYEFISVDDFGPRLDRRRSRGKPVAAVTFDDGYRDVYEHAFPVLKRKGIPAAFFVVTELVGTAAGLLHDRVYAIVRHLVPRWPDPAATMRDRLAGIGVTPEAMPAFPPGGDVAVGLTRAILTSLPYRDVRLLTDALSRELGGDDETPHGWQTITWEMLRAMRAAGMTIGSHTQRHIRLPNEDPNLQQHEATASRLHLEREVGRPVTHFAYPDGAFDSQAVRIVAAAGYRWAYTACRHRDPYYSRLTVPRLILWERSSIDFSGRLSASILRCQSAGMLGVPSCSYVGHA